MKKLLLVIIVSMLMTSCIGTVMGSIKLGFTDKSGNSHTYGIAAEYNDEKKSVDLEGEYKGVKVACSIAYEKGKKEDLDIKTDLSVLELSGMIKVSINGQSYSCEVDASEFKAAKEAPTPKVLMFKSKPISKL